MATNTMVVYGMVTSVVNAKVGSKLKFLPAALVLGGISIIGSTWLQLLNQFTDFLVVIGAFFVPVFAIMIVDYYIVKRGAYTKDILEARGGRYWYTAGVNWFAVAIWVIGATMSYVWAYVWPLPIGATIPAFVLTFVLYLAVMLPERGRHQAVRSQHLAETADADATASPVA
jgi:cytosine/uracil/thiamine/allantoin permease